MYQDHLNRVRELNFDSVLEGTTEFEIVNSNDRGQPGLINALTAGRLLFTFNSPQMDITLATNQAEALSDIFKGWSKPAQYRPYRLTPCILKSFIPGNDEGLARTIKEFELFDISRIYEHYKCFN